MSRKQYIKDTIENFITSDHNERLEQCTFGVEVETQIEDSASSSDWTIVHENLDREDYMDYDAYYDVLRNEVNDYISNNKLSDILNHASLYCIENSGYSLKYTWEWCSKKYWNTKVNSCDLKRLRLKMIISEIKMYEDWIYEVLDLDLECNDFKIELFNQFSQYFSNKLDNIYELDEALDYCIEDLQRDYIEDSEYYYDIEDIKKAHPDLFKNGLSINNNDLEVVDDHSISGKEIRTIGGLDQADFITAANDIFDTIDDSEHYTDIECSAHLHIKLGDINHYYGDGKLHGAIMEYLVWNLDRLPQSVQDRLKDGGNRWIQPKFCDNKYTWVNFHSQKTIEFRLFGNLKSANELLVCQKVALEALAYGYQVRFGDYSRSLTNEQAFDLACENDSVFLDNEVA